MSLHEEKCKGYSNPERIDEMTEALQKNGYVLKVMKGLQIIYPSK